MLKVGSSTRNTWGRAKVPLRAMANSYSENSISLYLDKSLSTIFIFSFVYPVIVYSSYFAIWGRDFK